MSENTRMGIFLALGLGLLVLGCGVFLVSDNLETIQSTTHDPLIESKLRRKLSDSLMRAAAEGDLLVVTALVQQGADINHQDNYGWTPLIQASMMNRLDVVKYLVVKGADINAIAEDGTNALQNAVIFDHVAMVRFLIARGARVEAKGKYGWDALETARQRDRKKVLNYFEHSGLPN